MPSINIANAARILHWFAHLLQHHPCLDAHGRLRKTLFARWDRAYRLITSRGTWLTGQEAKSLHRDLCTGLLACELLARESCGLKRPRWPLKPKHHGLHEVADHVRKTNKNPRSVWCFKHEDFQGKASRIASRCHPSTVSSRILQRWSLRFTLLRRHARFGSSVSLVRR